MPKALPTVVTPDWENSSAHDWVDSTGWRRGWDDFWGIRNGKDKDIFGNLTPEAAADKQTQQNRINQTSPWGSTNYHQNPDGTWSQEVGLAPGMQGSYDALMKQMQSAWSSPMDDGSHARDQAINAAYGQATSRLDPQWDMRSHQMESQLANQGLDPSSEAARNANAQFGRDRNDAYSSAMNNAVGLGNQAQAQAWNQAYQTRMAPMQALQQMRGLSNPFSFAPAGDYQGAQNQQNQQNAQMVGTAGTVAAAAFSDERLKQNVQRLPFEATPGVPMALFEYKAAPGQKHLGVIAQDLERVAPEHVTQGPGGYKMVSSDFAPFSFAKKR